MRPRRAPRLPRPAAAIGSSPSRSRPSSRSGIGLSVTMFSVLHAVYSSRCPMPGSRELVRISTPPHRAEPVGRLVARQHPRLGRPEPTFAGMTFYRRTRSRWSRSRGSTRRSGRRKDSSGPGSSNCSGLPRSPVEPSRPKSSNVGEPVVVLSEGLWREQFGGAITGAGQDALESRARITSSSASCRGPSGCRPGTRASGGPCRWCRRGRR